MYFDDDEYRIIYYDENHVIQNAVNDVIQNGVNDVIQKEINDLIENEINNVIQNGVNHLIENGVNNVIENGVNDLEEVFSNLDIQPFVNDIIISNDNIHSMSEINDNLDESVTNITSGDIQDNDNNNNINNNNITINNNNNINNNNINNNNITINKEIDFYNKDEIYINNNIIDINIEENISIVPFISKYYSPELKVFENYNSNNKNFEYDEIALIEFNQLKKKSNITYYTLNKNLKIFQKYQDKYLFEINKVIFSRDLIEILKVNSITSRKFLFIYQKMIIPNIITFKDLMMILFPNEILKINNKKKKRKLSTSWENLILDNNNVENNNNNVENIKLNDFPDILNLIQDDDNQENNSDLLIDFLFTDNTINNNTISINNNITTINNNIINNNTINNNITTINNNTINNNIINNNIINNNIINNNTNQRNTIFNNKSTLNLVRNAININVYKNNEKIVLSNSILYFPLEIVIFDESEIFKTIFENLTESSVNENYFYLENFKNDNTVISLMTVNIYDTRTEKFVNITKNNINKNKINGRIVKVFQIQYFSGKMMDNSLSSVVNNIHDVKCTCIVEKLCKHIQFLKMILE